MALSRETRFSRHYDSADRKRGTTISRFMDGSASITLAKLVQDWPTLTERDRMDFCQSCCWLRGQADFPDMLRFLIEHGRADEWSALALPIAANLRRDEAFEFLVGALHKTRVGKRSNFAQAIAQTKHRKAEAALRRHFQSAWSHKSLWSDDKFINWVAFDATTCIAHLVELGASPRDFEKQVRKLSEHVCQHNRDSCRNFLGRHYRWLR